MEFLHFLDKSTIFYENDDDTNRSLLGLPTSFPGSALGKAPKKILLQFTSKVLTIRVTRKLYRCTLPSSGCALGLCTVK